MSLHRLALSVFVASVLTYIVYAGLMVAMHRAVIYPFHDREVPVPGWERVTVDTAAPLPVTVLAAGKNGTPTVIYFMGNAGSVGLFAEWLELHRAAGRRVLALEYRGGGGLPGAPTEAGLKADALALYDWATGQSDAPVLVHGFSLGTGLAVYVAANRPVAGTILEAPFARLCDQMARATYLPACMLPVDHWDNLALAVRIEAPVLILHGKRDGIIPIAEADRFAAAATGAGVSVQFERFETGHHEDLPRLAGYHTALEAFIASTAP